MFELREELSNFHTIDLDEIDRNQSGLSDSIKNSIILYNKALTSLRTGSEDIAIIELKKAVTMNPHFYEALNLLGMCYAYKKENQKAEEIFDRIIKAESNSITALKLKNKMIEGESGLSAPRERNKRKAPETAVKESSGAGSKPGDRISLAQLLLGADGNKRNRRLNMLRILGGFAAGVLVILVISLLLSNNSKTGDVPVSSENTGEKTGTAADAGKDYKAMYDELNSKYTLLQSDKEQANRQADYYKSVIKLYDAESLYAKKQYENAADMLLLLKTTQFNGSDKSRYDSLAGSLMPKAAWEVFSEGYSLYNGKKYQDALIKLQKVEIYDPKFERLDAVLYYTGKCSQQLNDSRNAIALYQRLIDTYPNTSYAKNAKIKLRSLTETP